MKRFNILKCTYTLGLVLSALTMMSCENDEHKAPKLEFKTGAGYTSADGSVKQDSVIKVGIIATKVEDEFKTFNVSYAYDNATTTSTKSNEVVSKAEEDGFTKDVTFTTRKQAGKERWIFTLTDKDGNVSSLSLNFEVQ